MLKLLRWSFLVLFTCGSFNVAYSYSRAQNNSYEIQKDSLINDLSIKDQGELERRVTKFITIVLKNAPRAGISAKKQAISEVLSGFQFENKQSILLFLEGVYQEQLQKKPAAERAFLAAINEVRKTNDHYLLYLYFSHLAFLQTDKGNLIDAVYSYGVAKDELRKINDSYPEISLNINMADAYYTSGLYIQSLSCLDEAQSINNTNKVGRRVIQGIINNNKAEVFFKMHNHDSLKLYHDKLFGPDNEGYKLYSYQKRSAYCLQLLKGDYAGAIKLINELLKDSRYVKNNQDLQSLADAYFGNGQIDSAASKINALLAMPALNNQAGIRYHLYEMLGQIAQQKNNYNLAAYNFKLALEQSRQNINNLTQVGNLSSKIKIDEVQGLYYVNLLKYQRERLILILVIVIAVLMVIVITILYRGNRQKRHYEKLLYASQKHELAIMNSHEVRNHLSNILGLLDLLDDEENNANELLKTKDYLLYSAEQLDKALKNVSQKLSD